MRGHFIFHEPKTMPGAWDIPAEDKPIGIVGYHMLITGNGCVYKWQLLKGGKVDYTYMGHALLTHPFKANPSRFVQWEQKLNHVI